MKNYLKKHWFEYVFALVLTGISVLFISILFDNYIFSTNDDAMLRNIVSGNYTGTPDAHLVYIMYPLGLIWKLLYSVWPQIPWYDIFMVGMHYTCWFLIVLRVGQQFEQKLVQMTSMILSVGVLALIDLPYVVMHQYTVLAALLAAVAVFWLATSKQSHGLGYWLERGICLVFLALSLWVRKEVFMMTIPIIVLLLIKEIWAGYQEKTACKKSFGQVGIWLAMLLTVVALSYGMEYSAYRDSAWQEYQVYNQLRTDIYDYYGVPKYEKYQAAYLQIGISYGEWIAMDHYNDSLVTELSQEQMEAMIQWAAAEVQEARQYYNVYRKSLYTVVEALYYQMLQPIGYILGFAYLIALFTFYKRDDRGGMVCLGGLFAFQMLFMGYFLMKQRFPERVAYGFYLLLFLSLAGWIVKALPKKCVSVKKNIFWAISFCVVFITLFGEFGLYRMRTTLDTHADQTNSICDWQYINAYCAEQSENRYCIATRDFVFSAENMFDETFKESTNVIRMGTWVQNSPLEAARREYLGVENLSEQLVLEDNYYLLQENTTSKEWIEIFWKEQGYDVEAVVVETLVVPTGRQFDVISVR